MQLILISCDKGHTLQSIEHFINQYLIVCLRQHIVAQLLNFNRLKSILKPDCKSILHQQMSPLLDYQRQLTQLLITSFVKFTELSYQPHGHMLAIEKPDLNRLKK